MGGAPSTARPTTVCRSADKLCRAMEATHCGSEGACSSGCGRLCPVDRLLHARHGCRGHGARVVLASTERVVLASTERKDTPVRPLILIVDDEAILAEAMATYLERHAYAIAVASSGEEGVQLARERPPAVALLDLRLPSMESAKFRGDPLHLEGWHRTLCP